MKEYTVECDYFELDDAFMEEHTAVVNVIAEDEIDAICKARKIVPSSIVWRVRK